MGPCLALNDSRTVRDTPRGGPQVPEPTREVEARGGEGEKVVRTGEPRDHCVLGDIRDLTYSIKWRSRNVYDREDLKEER